MDILATLNQTFAKQAGAATQNAARPAQQPHSLVTQAAAQAKPTRSEMNEAQRNDAVKNFKKSIESLASPNLKFSIDKDTEQVVIKVVDKETGNTIRQIPSEEVLKRDQALAAQKQGMILQERA